MSSRPKIPGPARQERFSFQFEHRPAAAAASLTLTCAADASMGNADTLTLGDGLTPAKVYEYDKAGNGVAGSNIAVTAGTTAATVAANFKTAIEANQPALSVTDNADGTLTITHKIPGTFGNVTATESGALTVSGFSGGTASGETKATTTHQLLTLPAAFRVDSVEYVNPVGFAGHASNHWTLALKNGATTMASYTTDSDQAGQGTLTADDLTAFALSSTDADCVAAAGAELTLVITKGGTPANLPPGRITVHGRFI